VTATIYTDADANLTALGDRAVAVVGYGNQGAAQAQNLRDSGVGPLVVGNRDDEYAPRAAEAGFDVHPIAEAVERAAVVLLLIPDEVQPAVFAEQVAPHLVPGDTLVVASGYNVTFGLLDIPDGVDVVMVAPRMIGAAVRSRYADGHGFPCFVSAERDPSGTAWALALAVAKGIGGTRAGAVASSAREEAALDLFSEQAIWPAILGILRSGYEVLHEAGFSDEAVLYEMYLSGEPAEVFSRAAEEGLLNQLTLHSPTSQYGQLRALLRADPTELRERFSQVLHSDILSGRFAAEWSAAAADTVGRMTKQAAEHPLSTAEASVLRSPAGRGTR
jgi:ketol-acid reductoisomerase